MNIKGIKKFIIGTFFFLTPIGVGADFVYPIQEMSKVDCRFQDFNTLSSDCKMQLPILKTSEYSKYKNDYSLYRRVYTILWGSTYNYGWDIGNGGHQGVDIATAKGTPVYAMTNGKVVLAQNLAGRGNTVKIEHSVNGKKVYSNYSHLSKISVKAGDIIKTNTKIGEVGSTGNSTGNHLHFQIDLALSGKGPWYRSNCSTTNYDTIVNTSICFSQLNTNTIDPLLFLETSGAVIKGEYIVEKPKQENISQEGLLSREEILKREIEDFLKTYKVEIKLKELGGSLILGKKGSFEIIVTEKRTGKPFTGSFPGDMNFKYDTRKLEIFPTGILAIEKGKRSFTITPKLAGKHSLDIYLGETFFKKISFQAFDTSKQIIPSRAVWGVATKSVVSEIKPGAIYFKDGVGLNIVGVDFNGTYTLKDTNNNAKFCLKKVKTISQAKTTINTLCSANELQDSITFTSKDSLYGLVIFNYKLTKQGATSFQIIASNGREIGIKKLSGIYPKDILVSDPYYPDITQILNKGYVSGINKGYLLPERELSKEDGVFMIQNYLNDQYVLCKNDNNCRIKYAGSIIEIGKESKERFTYLSRKEFLELLVKYIPISTYNGESMDFRDISGDTIIQVKNILKGSTWNDYFGQTRYFQPEKKISRAEAIFLLNKAIQ